MSEFDGLVYSLCGPLRLVDDTLARVLEVSDLGLEGLLDVALRGRRVADNLLGELGTGLRDCTKSAFDHLLQARQSLKHLTTTMLLHLPVPITTSGQRTVFIKLMEPATREYNPYNLI